MKKEKKKKKKNGVGKKGTKKSSPSKASADLLSAESGGYDDLTFPIEALPEVLRPFVREGAQSISCPPDFIAVPLLVGLGAAIGRSRSIKIKDDWHESTALWVMVVGHSGTAKTPAMKLALAPIQETTLSIGTTWMCDTTVEALADVLKENGRGVILIRDELSGFVRGFDQYKAGKGSDEQFYLSVWDGTPTRVDRRNREDGPLVLKNPYLAIVGGIQPTVVPSLITRYRVESGFAPRFLCVSPPRTVRRFNTQSLSDETKGAVKELYASLLRLRYLGGKVQVARKR